MYRVEDFAVRIYIRNRCPFEGYRATRSIRGGVWAVLSEVQTNVCRKNIHDRAYLSIGVTSGVGRGYAGCLDGSFQGYRSEAIQDLGYELRRIPIPRTSVNKRKKE